MMIKKRMLIPKDPSQERKSKTFSKLNKKKKNKKKSIYAVYFLKISEIPRLNQIKQK